MQWEVLICVYVMIISVSFCAFIFLLFICVSEPWKNFRKSASQWIVGTISVSQLWPPCLTPTYLSNTAWQDSWPPLTLWLVASTILDRFVIYYLFMTIDHAETLRVNKELGVFSQSPLQFCSEYLSRRAKNNPAFFQHQIPKNKVHLSVHMYMHCLLD